MRPTTEPMRALIAFAALSLATGAQAASLNKCIDAHGGITYSNLPCRNAHEVRSVEIDAAPPPPARPQQARKPAAAQAAAPAEPASLHLETRRVSGSPAAKASNRQCDAIADKLGKVLDKMDQARRKGYTQEQMNDWNEDIQALEAKKRQAGCF